MEKQMHTLKWDLETVLEWSSRMTMGALGGKEPTEEETAAVKESCARLAGAGLYPFEAECSPERLWEQVKDFVQKGLEMG